ncbi:reverse transcriptase [Tanacetum coccineum]|uniref:Reverse transcriptase n=1 Tax=Tanacetum coccineum TaxID=301880 RepID=A0ABQ5CRP5_9ASTR
MSNLLINEAEHEVVDFADDDTHDERQFTLVGKVYTGRVMNFQKLKRISMAAWRPRRSVRIQELEDGLFLAMFKHVVDMSCVLDEGPWSVKRDMVILKPLDEDEQPSNMEMSKSPFWIRLLNLSFSRRSENYVRAIAGRLGTILEVDTHHLKEGSKYIRVRVMIDVSKPLCQHLFVTNRKHEKVTVGLCYERLPNFCYWCGHLGHTEKECLNKPTNIDGKVFENWPFQESLRAPPIRE